MLERASPEQQVAGHFGFCHQYPHISLDAIAGGIARQLRQVVQQPVEMLGQLDLASAP
ncbi:hypothetical protein D3C71_2055580 [compost metagenome]